jgi:putative membrane-bound dehydrogenase-like protein
LATAAAEEPPRPLKVLLVVGGCCHDYDAQKTILARGLEERAHVEVTMVHQGGSATDAKIALYERDDWAAGYDLVIHDECFADVKDRGWVDRILKPHRAGVPAVVLHCAMHCYRTGSDDWFEFCGVTSPGHGAHYPHEVLTTDGSHPIMQGQGAGWFNPAGELYHIAKVWPTAIPLASAKNRESGQEEVVAWANAYREKTRVFGTTLGHHNETVRSEAFLNLVVRGALWACNKLEPRYLKTPAAREVPVNVALKHSASASSNENKDRTAAAAFDGREQTRWCPNGPQANEWLQVDLGKGQTLTGSRIVWESGNNTYRYRVEGSADGTTWSVLHDGSTNKRPGPVDDALSASGIRHVKLTFLGSDQGGWGSIWEWELYGTEKRRLEPAAIPHDQNATRLLADVKVPEGFTATIFAAPPAATYPVFVTTSPQGDVYAAIDKNASLGREKNYGAIYRFRDLDGDGRADETKLFVDNIDSPRGMAWDHDRLYVLHPPHVSVCIDRDGDGQAEEQKVLVKDIAFTFKDRPADHTSNGLTLAIDGWLYLAIGDFGFMKAEGTDGRTLQLRGGGVVRVRPDGTGLELYSRGTRNILKVAVDPLLNGFSRDNTNDGGGWDIRLHHYSGLENHGYPSLFTNFGEEIVQPLADYGGGSGCGGLYLDEPGFPAGFGNALYTCDWGRSKIYRHTLTPNGATFKADETEFVSVPRVTDLDVDAHSRLFITSWKDGGFSFSKEEVGFIARVTPTGYQSPPLPDLQTCSADELLQLLQSPSHRRRLEAQRALVRRGLSPEITTSLMALARKEELPLSVRVAVLFTLKQGLGSKSHELLSQLATIPSLREFAVRALADRLEENRADDAAPLLAALTDPQPRVRNAAAISLARLGRTEHTAPLSALLDDSDSIVRHTAIEALIVLRAAEASFRVVDSTSASAAARSGALRVLQALHDPAVVSELIARGRKETDPAHRLGIIVALCRLYHREGEWKGNSWGTRPDTTGPYYQPETWSESAGIATVLQEWLATLPPEQAAIMVRELSRHKVQLSGALDKLALLTAENAALAPVLADEVARTGELPAVAIPHLIALAQAESSTAVSRAQAIVSLVRSDNPEVWSAVLTGLVQLDKQGRGQKAWKQARDAMFKAKRLETQLDLLVKTAADRARPAATWSLSALAHLATTKDASVEVKTTAQQAVDKAWEDRSRREAVIDAIGLAEARSFAEQLFAAEHESDTKIAAAARKVIKQLNLDAEKNKKTNSPLVESLPVDDVVARVVQLRGNVALGQSVFTRLECAKCHTVRADEPPKGPFLGTIANTYKRRELTEAILLPSKTLAQGFVTNLIVTDDGRQHLGFVVLEAADKVVLRTADAKDIEIPVASIEERNKLTTSVMPEGLAKKLTLDELASLVDYLESLPKK